MARTLSAEQDATLAELRSGLRRPQKELPSKLFYDERGSELFEQITRLPEYYLTRTEQRLLDEHVLRWIGELRPRTLIELGAGSAEKTRTILDAMTGEGSGATYVPVDISPEFLERTADRLRREYRSLRVAPVVSDFTRALPLPSSLERPALLAFLGSTIGNFTAPAAADLLRRMRGVLEPRDRLLLGTDVRKDVGIIEAAYNDSRGLTAAFNLNVLRVLERDFGATVDVGSFRHRAVYDQRSHCIEMHLVATRPQTMHITGVGDIELRAGETIRTEISCKYDRRSVEEMYAHAGLELVEWQEDPSGLFALSLARPAGSAA